MPLPLSTARLPPPSHPQHPPSTVYLFYQHAGISPGHPSTSRHGRLHPDVDSRHHEQEALAPMHNCRHTQSQPQQPPTPSPYRHHGGLHPPCNPRNHTSLKGSPAYTPGNQSMYGGMHTSSSAQPVKKKNTRASQACDSCRQLKAKCDELRPCKACRNRGNECKYRDPPPRVADKTQSDIFDGINMMQNQLNTLAENFGRMSERLRKIETSVSPKSDTAVNLDLPVEDRCKIEGRSINGQAIVKYQAQDPAAATAADQGTLPEDEVEVEPGRPIPPGEPAIPPNHTAPAGLLLYWPSIQALTKHHCEREGISYVGEYPISQEQNRGSLIFFGRGEDNRTSRRQRERETDQQSTDTPGNSSDSASPSTVTEAADWGHMGGLSPLDRVDYRSGVLRPDGDPDFSEVKVRQYVQSFKDNMLNMHPIVQPPILDQWVRQFFESFPLAGNKQNSKASTASAVSNPMEPPGAKRKRSSSGPLDSIESSSAALPTTRIARPNRTIHTALVLTVLALGKICLYRDDALYVGDPMAGGTFHPNGIPPLPKGSPPSETRSQSSSMASPHEQKRSYHGRRSPLAGNTRSGLLKKYENFPGLEYFAIASDILGNHLGSYNGMKNVYAYIFASLYYGQLGRPLESFSFIHAAGHKLQVIMRPSLEKLKALRDTNKLAQDTKYNQLSLAFWTCLQLESDLLAELPYPASGLLNYEMNIPHPNMSLLEGFSQPVLDSYLGQLYLRTHLNSIHRMFYAPSDTKSDKREDIPYKDVDWVSAAVSSMAWVASSLAFREEDPPASDILSARLRAKYWDAQVLTYRPFLRQVLQFSFAKKHPSIGQPSSEFGAEVDDPRIDPQARNVQGLDSHILERAEKAIKALVGSTRAFHGLGDKRPIITSVFSTAHAQWGNLLILSAAFKDPIMGQYVDEKLLRHLFRKTIAFLRQSATATSSLRMDMRILEGIQNDFWGIEPSYSSRSNNNNSNNNT